MGRKRKDIEDLKTTKSIRLSNTHWQQLENEQKRLKHPYLIRTLEYILTQYFKK